MTSILITEGRKLTLTLVSADNLTDVRKWGKMKVYAEVSINEAPETVQKIKADRRGGTNPRWIMATTDYMISEAVLQRPGANVVVVKLMCKRKMGDKIIGKVKIQIATLFEMRVKFEKVVMSYDVEGCPRGKLNMSYSFSDPTSVTVLTGNGSGAAAGTKRAQLLASLKAATTIGDFTIFLVKVFTGKI